MTRKKPIVVTAKEIRERLDIVARTLATWFARGLKCERDKAGRNPRVDLWDLVVWLYDPEEVEGAKTGGTSINLETYRSEKAREAKMKNDIAEGKLMKREDVQAVLSEISSGMRTEFEAISRAYGAEIGEEIRKAIQRARDGYRTRLKLDVGA